MLSTPLLNVFCSNHIVYLCMAAVSAPFHHQVSNLLKLLLIINYYVNYFIFLATPTQLLCTVLLMLIVFLPLFSVNFSPYFPLHYRHHPPWFSLFFRFLQKWFIHLLVNIYGSRHLSDFSSQDFSIARIILQSRHFIVIFL